MVDTTDLQSSLAQLNAQSAAQALQRVAPVVSFDRRELSLILNVYGKKVSSGDYKDYTLDMLADRAMFSIYQRASERPLFVVEKNPKLRLKQGQFSVIGADGRVLKRGQELAQVLRFLDPDLYIVQS